MTIAMITGIAGHGGVYFCQLLLEKEYVAYRTSHHTSFGNPVKAKAKLDWEPKTTVEQRCAIIVS